MRHDGVRQRVSLVLLLRSFDLDVVHVDRHHVIALLDLELHLDVELLQGARDLDRRHRVCLPERAHDLSASVPAARMRREPDVRGERLPRTLADQLVPHRHAGDTTLEDPLAADQAEVPIRSEMLRIGAPSVAGVLAERDHVTSADLEREEETLAARLRVRRLHGVDHIRSRGDWAQLHAEDAR